MGVTMLQIGNINVAAILIGVLSFICINLSYAILSLHSCPRVTKFISWGISLFLGILGLIICVQTTRTLSILERIINYILPSIIISAICGWLILLSMVYIFRYQVLYTNSRIRKNVHEQIQMQEDQFEKINLVTSDQVNLNGYLYKTQKKYKTPLAIYIAGRGEEATNIAEYASHIHKSWALVFINYRGCGLSTGRQNNKLLFSDAMFIYDFFSHRDDIDNNNIVLISHSLGTGIAIDLASKRKIKGIVLSCPYDRYVTGVLQDKLPLIPMKVLEKEEYDSLSIARKLKIPALFLLAEDDKTVVRNRSMRLINQWGSKKANLMIIKDTNHENITFNNFAWENINRFIGKLIS
jgi:Alpha/Beta hydrolase family of unknown function (DUF1234).